MLEGVETGYEAKFDFPTRECGPLRPYLLASVPRSGSTFFSHLLWRTGCLGAPLEYLNFDPAGPYGHADTKPAVQTELWRTALRQRTSPNGAFGLKAFPLQLQSVHQQNPALVAEVMRAMFPTGKQPRVVELKCRDRTAHCISYARALLSGIWRAEQEGATRPEPGYSAKAMADAERLIVEQDAAWQAMYRDLGVDTLVIWYEDALADGFAATAQVADYLGVAIDPDAAVSIPEVRKQKQDGTKAWADAHAKG